MVDALASGASVPRDVEVRVFSRVPKKKEIGWSLFSLVICRSTRLYSCVWYDECNRGALQEINHE